MARIICNSKDSSIYCNVSKFFNLFMMVLIVSFIVSYVFFFLYGFLKQYLFKKGKR